MEHHSTLDRRNTAALTISRKWELAVMVALPVCGSVVCPGPRAQLPVQMPICGRISSFTAIQFCSWCTSEVTLELSIIMKKSEVWYPLRQCSATLLRRKFREPQICNFWRCQSHLFVRCFLVMSWSSFVITSQEQLVKVAQLLAGDFISFALKCLVHLKEQVVQRFPRSPGGLMLLKFGPLNAKK